MSLLSIITQTTSILTLLSHIALLLFFVLLLTNKCKILLSFLKKNAMFLSFTIILFATILSLYYSEIAGYEPCRLCWFQRIFLYPQAFLFGTALLRKDKRVFTYTLPLTFLGLFIALYHTIIQFIPEASTCPATGVSCTAPYFIQFGYITIPVMSLTAFVFLLLLALVARQKT